jgi:hypothetical protein
MVQGHSSSPIAAVKLNASFNASSPRAATVASSLLMSASSVKPCARRQCSVRSALGEGMASNTESAGLRCAVQFLYFAVPARGHNMLSASSPGSSQLAVHDCSRRWPSLEHLGMQH